MGLPHSQLTSVPYPKPPVRKLHPHLTTLISILILSSQVYLEILSIPFTHTQKHTPSNSNFAGFIMVHIATCPTHFTVFDLNTYW
jgi:hypothetical protein